MSDGDGDLPFGQVLAGLMRERRLSFRGLAARTSLSAGYLNHLVHGNRPVPANEVLETIAHALDADPACFREYRLRVVTARLERLPDLVDRLYRDTAPR